MLRHVLRRIAKSSLPLLMLTVFVIAVAAANFPDTMVPLPAGWNGPVFHLSQNYPQQIPADTYPWLQFDPKTQPDQYMMACCNTVLTETWRRIGFFRRIQSAVGTTRLGCTGDRMGGSQFTD